MNLLPLTGWSSLAESRRHHDPAQRDRAFVHLGRELDAVGLFNEGDRARAFGRLALRLARFDQEEQAKRKANDAQRTAEGITDPARRARVLVELVDMLPPPGSWIGANGQLQIFPILPCELQVTNLMDAYATAGQIRLVKRIAETAQHTAFSIVDPDQQASALVRLAEEYTHINSEEYMLAAHKICGLVLTGPAWRRALFLIGNLDAQCS